MRFKLNEDIKDYSPENVKKDTCYAVAYSICKDVPYEKALQVLRNGSLETLKDQLLIKEKIPLTHEEEDITAEQFSRKHSIGTYMVLVDEHAMACVDGVLFDTQGYENDKVKYYFTFNKNRSNNETAYVDAMNSDNNPYIQYAIEVLETEHPDAVMSKNGDTVITSMTRGHSGFDLKFNGKTLSFSFPFLSTDKEVKDIINKTIKRGL